MVIYTTKVDWRGYQILMFQRRIKKVFYDFEVFSLTAVKTIAEVNYAQKVHYIRHIFNGKFFSGIIF